MIDKAVIVRAALFVGTQQIGPVITLTYFVNLTNEVVFSKLPVVSLVLDNADLYDPDTGIYVEGTLYKDHMNELSKGSKPANYSLKGEIAEREAHIDYFEKNYSLLFSQNVGIRIRGQTSRMLSKKGFNVFARAQYGYPTIENIFENGTGDLEAFSLMSEAMDFKLKNPFASIVAKDLDISILESFPCNLFLNGEYWGVYCVSEKIDENYFQRHYNVNNAKIVKCTLGTLESNDAEAISTYQNLLQVISQKDMSQKENFDWICNIVDINSVIDYYGFEMCIANEDWPSNNYAVWWAEDEDSPYSDGKWRFLLYDVDYSPCMRGGVAHINSYYRLEDDILFSSLFVNTEFRNMLAQRICDLMSITLQKDHAISTMDQLKQMCEESLRLDDSKYNIGRNVDEQGLYTEFIDFFNWRQEIMLTHTKETCQLTEDVTDLVIVSDNIEEGTVKIDGLIIDLSYGSWIGKYFNHMNIKLEAIPTEGYKFVGWQILSQNNEIIYDQTLLYALSEKGDVIKPLFVKEPENGY